MNSRCDEIDEMLAAFALDALEGADRLDVLEHVADCRLHDAELADLRSVSAGLSLLAPEVAPPARLEANLMRAFDQLAGNADPAVSSVPAPARTAPASLLQRLAGVFKQPVFAYGMAAALLVAGLGLGMALSNDGSDSGAVQAVVREVQQDGTTMRVVYLPGEKTAVLSMNVPPPPAGRTYQAWQITSNGQPVSLGTMDGSSSTVAFPADLSGATAIAISIEPAGGSAAPTTTPILIAEL